MVTYNVPAQHAFQKAKKHLTVVRKMQPPQKILLPPLTVFNTGYLKGKRFDPL